MPHSERAPQEWPCRVEPRRPRSRRNLGDLRDLAREALSLAATTFGGRSAMAREVGVGTLGDPRAAALRDTSHRPVSLVGNGSRSAQRLLIKLITDLDERTIAVRHGSPRMVLAALGLEVDKRTARSCGLLLARELPGLVSYQRGHLRIDLAGCLALAEAQMPTTSRALLALWKVHLPQSAGSEGLSDRVNKQQTDQSTHDLEGPEGTKRDQSYRCSRAVAFNTTGARVPEGWRVEAVPQGFDRNRADHQSASAALAGERVGRASSVSAGARSAQPPGGQSHEQATVRTPQSLTLSASILRVAALRSKWASLAFALILDHERASSGPWQAVGTAAAAARQLLEAHVARQGRARPVRAREVRDFAAGLLALAAAGCLDGDGEPEDDRRRWSKPRTALAPVLALYGIDPRPVTVREDRKTAVLPMPSDLHEIVGWMARCKAPTETQCRRLGRLGVNADNLSRAEATVLLDKEGYRYRQLGLKHRDLVWLLETHKGRGFAAVCLQIDPRLAAILRGYSATEVREWRSALEASDRCTAERLALPADARPAADFTDEPDAAADLDEAALLFADLDIAAANEHPAAAGLDAPEWLAIDSASLSAPVRSEPCTAPGVARDVLAQLFSTSSAPMPRKVSLF